MNVLIVFAHHEPSSFNAALLNASVAALRDAGHCVAVSDLYAMRFDPVSDRRNFDTVFDRDRLHQQAEELHASRQRGFVPELQAEMDKLARCDLLILQFPIWWLGMPAILKGWIDRVFACGVAYGGGRYFDRGVMRGKRAMLVVTVGGALTDYQPAGRYAADIEAILLPIQRGVLEFTGFELIRPFVAYGANRSDESSRRADIAALRQRIKAIALSPTGRRLERDPVNSKEPSC